MAKRLFQEMNVNYKAIELDRYENGSQFQDILHQMTGSRTVSTIFFSDFGTTTTFSLGERTKPT